jgi:hypothetical protein
MTGQLAMPELIVHEPLQAPRKNHIGEHVYYERWQELMHRMPSGWSEHDDDNPPAEIAMLSSILRDLHCSGEIGQREASVCASFIVWLGCNIGNCLILQSERLRETHRAACVLVAWTLQNRRSIYSNGGYRSIEMILSRDEDWHQASVGIPGVHELKQAPELTARDTEIVETLCCWLGEAGHGFVIGCEREISKRQAHADLLERRRYEAKLSAKAATP